MPATDAIGNGKYHFLDVGALRYGDCIVVEFGDVRVLIDGSHEKDFDGQDGYDSTPDQLKAVFKNERTPHPITLLVVTHCHQDHIGALPKLVSEGIIKPEWALITDHRLGFGRSQDDADSVDLADDRTRILAAALREEDASGLSDAKLQEFLDGGATVESKYTGMIAELKSNGVKVIEYQGQKLPAELLAAMKPTGMMLLGPTKDQLVLAAEQISKTNKDASDAVRNLLAQDAQLSDIDLYRRIVSREATDAARAAGIDTAAADFSNPRGNGMNCQSITLAFGPANARALLAGDMQFAEPGVKGADDEVARLREVVKAAGPFVLFKTTHHTSHNGQNDDILDDFGNPQIIVHSGGLNDPNHPFPHTLELLKARRPAVFARTDRNGRITVQPHLDPKSAKPVVVSKGRLNDFTDNTADDEQAAVLGRAAPNQTSISGGSTGARSSPQVIIVNLPDGPVDMSVAGVDIVVRGRAALRPTVPPIDRQRSDQPAPGNRGTPRLVGSSVAVSLAAGRQLPRLLFVTDAEKLAANIGTQEAQAALAAVRTAKGNHTLLDLAGKADDPHAMVHSALQEDSALTGIVILGGYDVVPSTVVDVLPPDLRALLGDDRTTSDGDEFFVWSDEPYGDLNEDKVAERPVSRLPDARDSTLFLTALQVDAPAPLDRFGVRNVARPFANSIWAEISGKRNLNVSKSFLSKQVADIDAASGSQYFMLHGSDTDATVFSGEDPPGYTRAFTVDKVPAKFNGVVFSGCCWGALTVSQKAVDVGTKVPAPRVAERSIALAYLKAGANAFVGCTGSHYSGPDTGEDANYAQAFHAAFWKTIPKVQYSASLALFGARKYYGDLIGSGTLKREPLDLARRLKNRAQFTCLGLGW